MEEYKSSKRISVYLSMPSEVQTEGILKVWLDNDKGYEDDFIKKLFFMRKILHPAGQLLWITKLVINHWRKESLYIPLPKSFNIITLGTQFFPVCRNSRHVFLPQFVFMPSENVPYSQFPYFQHCWFLFLVPKLPIPILLWVIWFSVCFKQHIDWLINFPEWCVWSPWSLIMFALFFLFLHFTNCQSLFRMFFRQESK